MDRETVENVFALFESKDMEGFMALFADDAVVRDPHYPNPEMKGKAAIRRGLEWAMGNMEQPGFTIRNLWIDGDKAAVEVDTHHVFKGGMKLETDQVFVIETQDGLVTRLQAYLPYRPGGVGGLMAKATGLVWRIRRK